MINMSLNVDNFCQDCPFFDPTMEHVKNNDGVHALFITCDRYVICGHIKDRIRKENKND